MVEYLVFGVGIHAGECIIQNQNSRIANDGPGDGGALLLPSRKSDPALPHQSSILLRKPLDIIRNAGRLSRGTHRLVARTHHAKSNVFADSLTEQKGFLWHKPYVFSQYLQRIVTHRFAVNQHGT